MTATDSSPAPTDAKPIAFAPLSEADDSAERIAALRMLLDLAIAGGARCLWCGLPIYTSSGDRSGGLLCSMANFERLELEEAIRATDAFRAKWSSNHVHGPDMETGEPCEEGLPIAFR